MKRKNNIGFTPLGSLLADVSMRSIEETLLREGKVPSSYKGYVDDMLTVMLDITSAARARH